MKIDNETLLLDRIRFVPIVILIFFSALTTYLTINNNSKQLKEEITHLREDYIEIQKGMVKREVNKIYNIILSVYNNDIAILRSLSKENVKKHILKRIESMKYDKNGYIFIVDYEGNFLINIKKTLLEENQMDLKDKNGLFLTKQIIETAKKGEGYISYIGLVGTHHEQSQKISFIKGFEPWGWAVGYGFHPSDIEPEIVKKVEKLSENHKKYIEKLIVLNILLTISVSVLLIMFSKNINKIFKNYKDEIDKKEEKNRKKDEIIYHQSKMATIGELLNIISHQWRQPLAQINSVTLDTYLEQRNGTLDEKILKKNISDIENTTEYLSQTIDDFSGFFIQEKEKKLFSPNKAIEGCLKILEPTLKDVDIKLDLKSKNEIEGFITLFQQVILTIVTNSLDAFDIKSIKDPFIKIDTYDAIGSTFIEITDNGGGIDAEHLAKVFDLYFSTKQKDTPSGLGLYIAKKIIVKNMNGRIKVKNTLDGVKFIIKV